MTSSNDRTRWTDERLDRLADSVVDLRSTAEALLQTVVVHQNNFETMQNNFNVVISRIDVMQGEIRGLQLENRRMLEELRGRRDEGEEP